MTKIAVVVLISILLCKSIDAQLTFVGSACTYGESYPNYTQGSIYEINLQQLLKSFIPKSSSLQFYNTTVGNYPNIVYGLYQCRFDVSLNQCNECINGATQKIIKGCPLSKVAGSWYYECTVWYSNKNIFSDYETEPNQYRFSNANATNYDDVFGPTLSTEINKVIEKASSSMPHVASSVANLTLFEKLYSFAQCTPNIDSIKCSACLGHAIREVIRINDARNTFARMFYPSCQLRYEMNPFLNSFLPTPSPPPAVSRAPPPGPPSPTSKKSVTVGAIGTCVAVGLVVLCVALWFCFRRKRHIEMSDRRIPLASLSVKIGEEGLGNTEFVRYDFVTLKTATTNFSDRNKLGEGGFGAVYKGTLAGGEQIAIKRLSGSSGQGTKEFMAEAGLLAKLQHRNLVKLVGFCSEGDEKLLVYEFLSNSSLDSLLFDQERRSELDWVVRSKIVLGITRGLQYLHEGSRLTIIHRDLKPANILLDYQMNPKIADFGLAKLFEAKQTYASTTGITGTIGYMAPEYLERGEYSDKSDVYSFGIMLLEIISGHNNKTIYRRQQEDLPIYAWRLWNEDRSFDLIDPILNNNNNNNNNSSRNEMIRYIQISLLCLQANAEQRPTMTELIQMLTCSIELPVPSTPAMSFPQFNMPSDNSGRQQTNSDQYFSKSSTRGSYESKNTQTNSDQYW